MTTLQMMRSPLGKKIINIGNELTNLPCDQRQTAFDMLVTHLASAEPSAIVNELAESVKRWEGLDDG